MSKKSRRNKAQRALDCKMGMYNQFGGKSPEAGFAYTKPGSKQIKG